MEKRYGNLIVELACQLIAPFILLFGLYVIFHGHHSPGGGFQGGAILAAMAILLRLSLGMELTSRIFSPRLMPVFAAAGLLIFAGVGVAAIFGGGNFLDYGAIPVQGVSEPSLHHNGILLAELGIALSVFGVMLSIFDTLIRDK